MADKRNDLRMPFAEWLYRMSEASVPYQARALAVYAVTFSVTANEELACLVGMDTKGVADKTYNKWKRWLSDNGWVIVKQVTVGRTTTIEVAPALRETPVTFTDVIRRVPTRFKAPSSVPITDVPAVEVTTEPVKVTDGTSNNYGPAVETTPENQPSPARLEPPSGVVISNIKQPTTTVETTAARDEGVDLDTLNGSAVDLMAFIAKYASVDMKNAERMLNTNIRAFSADAMLEAYSVTMAEMATGGVASPYKYLMKVATGAKDRAKSAPRAGGAKPEKGISRLKQKFLDASPVSGGSK